MKNSVYSYHTFLFPFIWKHTESQTWKDFSKVLSIGTRWKEISWKKEAVLEERTKEEWFQDYAAFQYFTEPANNVIFNTRGDNVVRCFEFLPNGNLLDQKTSIYVIQKNENIYRLQINKVRLQVYDIGIAILVFELENNKHKTLNDVNAINEYGRRINFPFLTSPGCQPLCADKISVYFNDTENVFSEQNYNDTLDKVEKGILTKKELSLSYVMKPIQKILDNGGLDNGGYTVTSNKGRATSKNIYIKPCVDDRMFVCCLVRDDKYSEKIQKFDVEKGEYHYLSDCYNYTNDSEKEDLSSVLYKLFYIETSMTCQSKTMRYEILKKSVYDRWIDWGTCYAVTHHSHICLTGEYEGIIASVINPFLTEYVQIAILTLAQRSAILLLSTEAAVVANGFSDDKNITADQIQEIETLQAKYVKIQNQLLLSEITVQEQGVELYNMMKEQLYLTQNANELDKRMINLRETANISHNRLDRKSDELENENEKKLNLSLNIIGMIFALIAIFEPFAGWIIMKYSDEEVRIPENTYLLWWVLTAIFTIVGIILFIISNLKNKMERRKK